MTNATAKTAVAQAGIIGTVADYRVQQGSGSMIVHVRITDVRMAFGRVDCEIQPVTGTGTTWVARASLDNLRAGQ